MCKIPLLLIIVIAMMSAGGCAENTGSTCTSSTESGLPIHGADLKAQKLIMRFASLYASSAPQIQRGFTDASGIVEFEFATHSPYKVTTNREGYNFEELVFDEIRREIDNKTLVIMGRAVADAVTISEYGQPTFSSPPSAQTPPPLPQTQQPQPQQNHDKATPSH